LKKKYRAFDNGLGLFLTIGCTVLLASCDGAQSPDSVATPKQDASVPASIDPGVFEPYKREGWTKLFASWGDKGIARIQRLREAAAQTVAKNPSCDTVEISDISESRSTAPNEPVVLVDCKNGERFYLSERDTGGFVQTEMQKGARFSSADLIRQCTEAVRNRLTLPATFDQSMFSVSERQGGSGNRVVEFEFEAKNRIGLTLPAQAKCIMTTEGEFEVTVIE
jgi:hypothetical protein